MSIGAWGAVHPAADPMADVAWADQEESVAALWFCDLFQGWLPRGLNDGAFGGDPHQVLDAFCVMAAAAARSRRVTIGVSVTDVLRRPAAVLLQAALTVSWLGGRPMILGIGTGMTQNLRPYGLDTPRRVAALAKALGEMEGLQRGATPTDARSDTALVGMTGCADVDVWLGAHGPRMLELTGRFGDGWLPSQGSGLGPDEYARRLRAIRQHAAGYGRDPHAVTPALYRWAALAPTARESEDLLRTAVVRATALYGRNASDPTDYVPGNLGRAEAAAAIAALPPHLVEESILHGSLDEVDAELRAYEKAGCRHVVLIDLGRYADPDGTDRSRTCLRALAATRSQ